MVHQLRALQWQKLALAGCLRGRVTRYVAAAALWHLAACGCCFVILLPLTTLLGVAAAALLPSFLRCVELVAHGLLRRETLLLEFVHRVPYYCVGIESRDGIAVPWLHSKQLLLPTFIKLFRRLLQVEDFNRHDFEGEKRDC